MIKFGCELLDATIEFSEDRVNILEINNKKLFNEVVYRLNKSINMGEDPDGIILIENDEEIAFSKNALIIYDFFNVDVNQGKVIKKLYEDIEKEFKFNYEEEEIIKLQKELLTSIRDILMEYDYEFTQKEVLDIKDILKIMELKFDTNYYDKPLENIFLLFDLISNFQICKVMILVNAKCYFSSSEIIELYKMAKCKRINLLMIEYYSDDEKLIYENKIIIDEDYVEFYIR